ncbi:hypothetical protein ACFVRD_31225 [Streptomyces sp. NPDC057908]|uniref:hypothetical protein n=1 Tax=Streptomyces sp. NPDC057908 TaxID=3346276 RepID=UPI0036F119D4
MAVVGVDVQQDRGVGAAHRVFAAAEFRVVAGPAVGSDEQDVLRVARGFLRAVVAEPLVVEGVDVAGQPQIHGAPRRDGQHDDRCRGGQEQLLAAAGPAPARPGRLGRVLATPAPALR